MCALLRKAVGALFTRLASAFGLLGVSGAIVIVAGQCFSWLQFDSWPEITLFNGVTALGWSIPTTWFGVNTINKALDLRFSLIVLAFGLAPREIFVGLAALQGEAGGVTSETLRKVSR